METFQKESCVRGYHIYKELWDAVVGEELECQRERGNGTDLYAVAVIKTLLTLATYHEGFLGYVHYLLKEEEQYIVE